MTKKEFKESILRCRGIDWAEKGMKVQLGNEEKYSSIIVGINSSGNLDVKTDKGMKVQLGNEEKYSGIIVGINSSGNLDVKTDKGIQNWHPTWNIVYFKK